MSVVLFEVQDWYFEPFSERIADAEEQLTDVDVRRKVDNCPAGTGFPCRDNSCNLEGLR